MNAKVHVDQALAAIRQLAWKASSLVLEDFDYWIEHGREPEYRNTDRVELAIETAFLQLLALTESLGQSQLSHIINATYQNAKRIGLGKIDQFEDHSAWSSWSAPVHQFADTIDAVYGAKPTTNQAVSTDLLTLLQNIQGAITDKRCFTPPQSESEVHDRIEAILRCVYPDLLRKPPLAKHVANFIPDSGIRSISTLIEYKYMSQEKQAGPIANEILADTRGYAGSEWERIVFVIYETSRFKTAYEWRELLVSCGLKENIQLVLLYGEEPLRATSSAKTKIDPKKS